MLQPAHGAAVSWTSPTAGGLFSGSNWTGGTPNSTSDVTFGDVSSTSGVVRTGTDNTITALSSLTITQTTSATTGTDAINGTFISLNGTTTTLTEGSQFTWNRQQWKITYQTNSEATTASFPGGNNVAIMVVPEPATWSMIVGGLGMMVFIQRARRRMSI